MSKGWDGGNLKFLKYSLTPQKTWHWISNPTGTGGNMTLASGAEGNWHLYWHNMALVATAPY